MDSKTDSKSLKNLLTDADSPLGALADRAASMVALRDQLAASLPDGLGGHITGAAVDSDRVLVVVCASAAWAARLRFHADDLLACARRNGVQAARCRVRARPVRQ
ncbi:MAG: DciA family protein [Pseudomonadota bacterium]